MFEAEPIMDALIQASITANEFSLSNVHLYHTVVGDFPMNTTFKLKSLNDEIIVSDPIKTRPIRLDGISWPSSIFVLKIDFDNLELDALRSGDKLFRSRRVRHLILHYDAVKNSQAAKQELINYLQQVVRPKYVYIFHPSKK